MVHLGTSLFGIFEILNNYGTSWKIYIVESPLNIATPTPAPDHSLEGHLFFSFKTEEIVKPTKTRLEFEQKPNMSFSRLTDKSSVCINMYRHADADAERY